MSASLQRRPDALARGLGRDVDRDLDGVPIGAPGAPRAERAPRDDAAVRVSATRTGMRVAVLGEPRDLLGQRPLLGVEGRRRRADVVVVDLRDRRRRPTTAAGRMVRSACRLRRRPLGAHRSRWYPRPIEADKRALRESCGKLTNSARKLARTLLFVAQEQGDPSTPPPSGGDRPSRMTERAQPPSGAFCFSGRPLPSGRRKRTTPAGNPLAGVVACGDGRVPDGRPSRTDR